MQTVSRQPGPGRSPASESIPAERAVLSRPILTARPAFPVVGELVRWLSERTCGPSSPIRIALTEAGLISTRRKQSRGRAEGVEDRCADHVAVAHQRQG